MKPACAALVCLGFLAPLLAGCGASPPPLSLACLTHHAPGGVVRSRVTVTNHTGRPVSATLFGPAIFWTRFVSPMPPTSEVAILLPGGRRATYIGFVVRNVPSSGSRALLFRLAPRARGLRIDVASRAVIHATSLRQVQTGSCVVAVKG